MLAIFIVGIGNVIARMFQRLRQNLIYLIEMRTADAVAAKSLGTLKVLHRVASGLRCYLDCVRAFSIRQTMTPLNQYLQQSLNKFLALRAFVQGNVANCREARRINNEGELIGSRNLFHLFDTAWPSQWSRERQECRIYAFTLYRSIQKWVPDRHFAAHDIRFQRDFVCLSFCIKSSHSDRSVPVSAWSYTFWQSDLHGFDRQSSIKAYIAVNELLLLCHAIPANDSRHFIQEIELLAKSVFLTLKIDSILEELLKSIRR